MNVTDSIPSSDNNRYVYTSSGKSTDSQNTTSVDAGANSDRHGYFVPLIMLIVLGVIFSATFFDKSISGQVTDVTSPEQNNRTAAPVNTSTGAGNVAYAEITTVNSTVSDITTLKTDVTGSKTTKDQFQGEIAYKAVTTDQHIPGYDGSESHAYLYTKPYSYGMPGKRAEEHNKIMQARRMAFDASMQTPRQHKQMMREYRAVVLKRVRQDRRDRHRHLQDI